MNNQFDKGMMVRRSILGIAKLFVHIIFYWIMMNISSTMPRLTSFRYSREIIAYAV